MVLNAKDTLKGLNLAVEATQFAVHNKRVQAEFVKVLKYTVLAMTAVYIALHVLVFPLLLLLKAGSGVTSTLFRIDTTESQLHNMSTTDAVNHFMDSLPLLGLDLIIHVNPGRFESIFIAMLDEVDIEYSKALMTWPKRKHHMAKIAYKAKSTAKRYMLTLLASNLSRLPIVGWLVIPAGALMMMMNVVGAPASAGIALLSMIVPGSKNATMFLFKSVMAMRDFSQDVLKPYFTRLGMKPKTQAQFYKLHESAMVGFVTAFYFFVQMSWIGPAFFVLAQGAIALFISRMTPRPPIYKPGMECLVTDPKKSQ